MPAAEMKQRWKSGEPTYGARICLESTWTAEVFAKSGLDFVWLDQQHGLITDGMLVPMFQAMNGTNVTPLIRISENNPAIIGRVLDAGAEGIIVPGVETAADAERAVAACRHPPEGIRSNGIIRLEYLPGGLRRETLCLVQIESETGVNNVDAITSVPGVDGVLIGPSDLALTMGIPPRPGIQPGPHEQAIARVRQSCIDHGIVAGFTGDAQEMRALGFQFISLGGDHLFMVSALKAALARR